jgi:hypothetical protein
LAKLYFRLNHSLLSLLFQISICTNTKYELFQGIKQFHCQGCSQCAQGAAACLILYICSKIKAAGSSGLGQ